MTSNFVGPSSGGSGLFAVSRRKPPYACMPRKLHWSEERLRRLTELWPDPTWTITAIGRELGMTPQPVIRRAKELGLEGRIVAAGRWRAAGPGPPPGGDPSR
jgi:hypothetical protein